MVLILKIIIAQLVLLTVVTMFLNINMGYLLPMGVIIIMCIWAQFPIGFYNNTNMDGNFMWFLDSFLAFSIIGEQMIIIYIYFNQLLLI